MKNILILLVALLLSSSAYCQQKTEAELLDQFFETYEKNPIKAIDNLYKTTKWIDRKGDEVENLKARILQIIELIGGYHGEEFITKEYYGSSFVSYIYVMKYDRQPIRFTFDFYKPNDTWFIFSFRFDDSLNDDLREYMKYAPFQKKE